MNKVAGGNGKEQKRPGKKRKNIRWGTLLVVFLLCFGIYNFGQEYFKYRDLKGEVTYYQGKLQNEKQEYASLQKEKGLLYDDSYLEKLAREDLGMIKKGETLILPMEENADVVSGEGNVASDDIH